MPKRGVPAIALGLLLMVSVVASMPRAYALSYSDTVLADGPIGYWRFEETSGTTASDSAGSNDGTLSGGASLAATGKVGSGLSLDGVDGIVNVGGAVDFSFGGTAPFSLEAWVDYDPGGHVITKFNAGVIGEWRLVVSGTGITTFAREVAPFQLSTDETLPPNQYNHVVATYDGSVMRIYHNGVLAESETRGAQATDTSTDVLIGATFINGTPGSFWNGLLDEVAIYDFALSASQIQSHFNAAPSSVPVGGEILPIDMTSLMVAGAFMNAYWILPMLGVLGAIVAVARGRRRRAKQ